MGSSKVRLTFITTTSKEATENSVVSTAKWWTIFGLERETVMSFGEL